jgi:hypothetical protein
VVVILAIRTRPVQTFLAHKGASYLSKKLKTTVTIGSLYIEFPKSIVIQDLYLESQQKDTLFFSKEIEVDVAMMGLFHHLIEINSFEVRGLSAHIKRTMPDSAFNFAFITKAFAGDSTKKATPTNTTKPGWSFILDKISLKDIYFTFNDQVGGDDINTHLWVFTTDFKTFDLKHNKFDLSSVVLENTIADVSIYKETPADTSATKPFGYDITLEKLTFNKVKFNYTNSISRQKLLTDVVNMEVKGDKLDIQHHMISLKEFSLNNSRVEYAQNKYISTAKLIAKNVVKQKSTETANTPFDWVFKLSKLDMKDNILIYDDFNQRPLHDGIDYNHLYVDSLGTGIRDIQYSANRTFARVDNLRLREKSGLDLLNLRTVVTFDSIHSELKDLDLRTSNTHLKKYIAAWYPSLSGIGNDVGNLRVLADIQGSEIGLRDILIFQPALRKQIPFKRNPDLVINIAGRIQGKVKDLAINDLEASTLHNTNFRIHGTIKGLPNINKTYFNLEIARLGSGSSDLNRLLPYNTIPASIHLPSSFNLMGDFKGSISKFAAHADIKSTLGGLTASIKMNPVPTPQNEAYTLKLISNSFNLGHLLGQDSMLGVVTLNASVNGAGTSIKTMDAHVYADVQNAFVNHYNYSGFHLEGDIKDQAFTGVSNMDDPNVQFNFNGIVGLSSENPTYKFKLDLLGIDLQKLHLTSSDVRLKGIINSDLTGTSLNDMKGTAGIGEFAIIKNDKLYSENDLVKVIVTDSNNKTVHINSDLMNATFTGSINFADLPKDMLDHFQQYFSMHVESQGKDPDPQDFDFNIQLYNPAILSAFIPDLTRFEPGSIVGHYSNEDSKLKFDMNIPELAYGNYLVDSLVVKINSDKQKLNYDLGLRRLGIGGVIVEYPGLSGKIEADSIITNLTMKDSLGKTRFRFATDFKSLNDEYRIHFRREDIMLNYIAWRASPDNYLSFSKDGIIAHRFKMYHGGHSVLFNSESYTSFKTPINIEFKEFDLGDITGFLQNNKSVAKGFIDGKMSINTSGAATTFNADLNIKQLAYLDYGIGDVTLKANNKVANHYDIAMAIKGSGNDLSINGFYAAKVPSDNYNLNLDIRTLNLKTIEPFTGGQLKRMSGNLDGSLKMSGTTDVPYINGDLNFHQAGFMPTAIGSYYTIDDGKIGFDRNGISFSDLTLRDSTKHTATINGYVYTKYFKEFRLNLDVLSDHFRVLNTDQRDNQRYYGTMVASSRIRLRGLVQNPVIDANVKVEDGTDFFVVNLPGQPGIEDRQGIVVFVDSSHTHKGVFYKHKTYDTIIAQKAGGLSLNANIEIDPKAKLTIIVDPDAGDHLRVQGQGTLSLSVNPGGAPIMTGRYEISQGTYQLTFYNFVKRSFDIRKGSYITWEGNALRADININADYKLRTSPIDLVQSQIGEITESEKNQLRQQLPFIVTLKLTGDLLKPVIKMDINLPPDQQGAFGGVVNNKLYSMREDESEMNKQVFALLVLSRFLPDDPLSKAQGGLGLKGTAYQSVSKIISGQLNTLASKYVRDVQVDINLDTREDYITGSARQVTDANLKLSKSVLNDRLTFRVQGDVNLNKPGQPAYSTPGVASQPNQVVSDVSIEYKLTKDGRLSIVLFRDNQYAGVIEGQIVETGTGLVFVRDFDRFKQLFQKPKNENFGPGAIENNTNSKTTNPLGTNPEDQQ